MRCLLRTDIGGMHGMGHAVRCLALAKALQARGAEVSFVTTTPALAMFVAPFICIDTLFAPPLPEIDVYVVDTKDADLNEGYYATVRRNGPKVVRIDHPYATPDSCDLLIAPVAHWSPETVSRLRTAFGAHFLYGWEYVMLAPEVTAHAPVPYAERQDGLIVFCAGGSDPHGALAQMWAWSQAILPDVHKIYCVGQQHIDGTFKKKMQEHRGVVPFSRTYLAEAALVVGLFGMTCYEALWYRTPMLCFARDEQDRQDVKALDAATLSAVQSCGALQGMSQRRFCDEITAYWESPHARPYMHDASAGLLDGLGTQRVADAILGLA